MKSCELFEVHFSDATTLSGAKQTVVTPWSQAALGSFRREQAMSLSSICVLSVMSHDDSATFHFFLFLRLSSKPTIHEFHANL